MVKSWFDALGPPSILWVQTLHLRGSTTACAPVAIQPGERAEGCEVPHQRVAELQQRLADVLGAGGEQLAQRGQEGLQRDVGWGGQNRREQR